jgi:hypothetical protein
MPETTEELSDLERINNLEVEMSELNADVA